MKKILILILIILFLPLIPKAAAQGQIKIDIERDIEIEKGGLVYINDIIRLSSLDGDNIRLSNLTLGFHETIMDEDRNFTLDDDQEIDYEEINMDEGFRGYRLELPEMTISSNNIIEIHASYFFVNRVSWINNYTARLPIYPAMYQNISSISTSVKLPEGADLVDIFSEKEFTNYTTPEHVVLEHDSNGIPALSDKDLIVVYTSPENDLHLIDCEFVERGVNVYSGKFVMKDKFRIVNRGKPMTEFNMTLPSESTDIRARDSVGPIEIEVNSSDTDKKVSVKPRSTMYQWFKWEFTVIYEMPSENYISKESGENILRYSSLSFPYFVRDQRIRVTLPKGGSAINSNPQNVTIKKKEGLTNILFKFGETMPKTLQQITISYNLNPIIPLIGPITVSSIIVILFIGSVLLKFRRKPILEERVKEEETLEPVIIEGVEVGEFTEIYEQRLNQLRELEKLDNELTSGRMDLELYDSRVTEIRSETQEILMSLNRKEENLLKDNPSLAGTIEDLKQVEESMSNLEIDLNNLERRYRAGRIARRNYYNRRRSLTDRRSSAIKRIKDILDNLK